MSYFLHHSPKPFQRSPSYLPDPGTKHDAHENGICLDHNLSRSRSQHHQLIISQKMASNRYLISDMITANEKILGKVEGSQNVHHEVFSPHFVNH